MLLALSILAETPLDSIEESRPLVKDKIKGLTAYMSTGSKLLGHLWVHRDHDLLFISHKRVPFLNLLIHPFFEILADDGSANVDKPLLGYLGNIRLVGQVDDYL